MILHGLEIRLCTKTINKVAINGKFTQTIVTNVSIQS